MVMEPILCYNRGCGQTYVPSDNDVLDKDGNGPCQYHVGHPVFHDAYKSWSCCNKRAIDFTEFLNYKGCTRGPHTNVKPVEPEKLTGNLTKVEDEVIEVRAPIAPKMARPSYNTPLTRLTPSKIAPALKATASSGQNANKETAQEVDGIKVGEACKNGGCKGRYTGEPGQVSEACEHHPGSPIFHEGMKYWSCCQKKTSDFTAFLNQVGCSTGQHKWKKESTPGEEKAVKCRYDWHQTATKVTVAIYAKKYDPEASYVDLSPVRLKIHLFFPAEDGSFDLDIELRGVVNVEETSYSMLGTKVEIGLIKAEPGSWADLDLPKGETATSPISNSNSVVAPALGPLAPSSGPKVDALDLDDLDLAPRTVTLSAEASGGRTEAQIL